MKTVIVYESTHHGNTKKLVDAIAARYDVETIGIRDAADADLSQYDCIGIASGVAFAKFYPATEKFAAENIPSGKKVFFLYTCGRGTGVYTHSIRATVGKKACTVLGTYGCQGYDTFGPFKLVGGIAKGHPTDKEVEGAVAFYEKIIKEMQIKI